MRIAKTFRRLFEPSLETLDADGRRAARRSGGPFGPRVVVLSRALCRYRFHAGDYTGAPARKALELELRFDAPIQKPGFYIRSGAQGAEVWTWDRAALPESLSGASAPRLMPETALEAPALDGPRQVRCLDGIEGQVWREGRLRTSRWWAHAPDAAAWRVFLRAARTQPVPADSSPSAQSWRDPPLIDGPLQPWLAKAATRHFGLIAILLLSGPFSYQFAQWAHAYWAYTHYSALTRELRQQAQPLLAARRDSLTALAETERVAALGDESLLLAALLEWAEALADSGLAIQRLRLEGVRIEIYADGAGAAGGDGGEAAAIVQALENMPTWQRVSLQSSSPPDTVVVRGELVPFAAPLGESPDTEVR